MFGGQGIRTLRFDVEMLLTVHVRTAFENLIASFECCITIAELESFRRHDEIAVSGGDPRIEYWFELFDIGADLLRSFPSELFRFCKHDSDRHSLEMNFAIGKQRF